MPRAKQSNTKPSAGGKYAVSGSGRDDGHQLHLEEVATPEQIWALVEDAVRCGVNVTLGLTKDNKTLAVTFFHDGERYPWYIQSVADWQEMVQAIEG